MARMTLAEGMVDAGNAWSSNGPVGKVFVALLVIAKLSAAPLMFQYILSSWFNQDVPWYVDIAAGFILDKYHLPALFAITLVIRYCDYGVPLFKSVKAALGY